MTLQEKPWLTIVIPTIGRASRVGRAVDSALSQDVPGIEIIVSDNASTDATASVLAGYGDPRLRCFRHDRMMSVEEHGNFLIGEARGEFFLWLSDDDFLEQGFSAAVREHLNRFPWLDFVYTGAWIHYEAVAVPTRTGPELETGEAMLRAFYAGLREVCWCACVCRLSAMRQIGAIPSGCIFGDMFYWTRLALQGDVGCIARPLSHYSFMTEDNLSTGVPIQLWAEEVRQLADDVIASLPECRAAEDIRGDLQADAARFLARSTANQVVWGVIRGARRKRLLAEIWCARHHLMGDPRVWLRALAALLLPRIATKGLVLAAAGSRSQSRLCFTDSVGGRVD